MNTLYLWINILTLLFPLVLSFDKKVAFYKKWPALFPAILLTGTFFVVWDHFFTLAGVWGFNTVYVTGYFFKTLPIEELMFFFTVPYACVFIYECLIAYFPGKFDNRMYWLYTPIVLLLLIITGFFIFYTKMYSGAVGVVLIFMAGLKATRKKQLLKYFIPAFLISIIPMLIVNGILTAKPVVYYNPEEFSGIRVGTIPIEDFFYNLSMLLMCVLIYDGIKKMTSFKKPKVEEVSTLTTE